MNNIIKKADSLLKLVSEAIGFALTQLKVDKFRTFLSLLGVSIGIFSIVAVLTAVDSLRNSVNEGFSSFGNDLIFLSSMPMSPEEGDDGVFKWWEYRKRPPIIYAEYLKIKDKLTTCGPTCYYTQFSKKTKYRGNSFNDGSVMASTAQWDMVIHDNIEFGRNFSIYEMESGTQVAILGYDVKEALFPNGEDAIQKIIKIGNVDAIVIGVFEKSGSSAVNMANTDKTILIPIGFAGKMVNLTSSNGEILAKPKEGVSKEIASSEMINKMRSVRSLKLQQKNNFSLCEMSFLMDTVSEVFKTLNMIVWIIGGFSLLIGGFGIANIMFVSVKERTHQIGIQKALGAKKYVITLQFLVEAATLSLAGGLIGILLVYIATKVIPVGFITLSLSLGNVMLGSLIAIAIGLIAGVLPARSAANLHPVEAINE